MKNKLGRRDFIKGIGVTSLSLSPFIGKEKIATGNTVADDLEEEPHHKWLLIAEFEVTSSFLTFLDEYLEWEGYSPIPLKTGSILRKGKPFPFKSGGGEVYIYNPESLKQGKVFVGKIQKRRTGDGTPYKRIIIKPKAYEKGDCIPYSDKEFTIKVARYFLSCDAEIEKIKSYWKKETERR